jgi:HPt (histidine-containing phosphotransfer) domain-containing protein
MIPARIPDNEIERLQALQELDILSADPVQSLDELTQTASAICEAPVSLVTLIDKDRQFFKSRVNLDVIETPREISFCAHAILGNDLMVVEDATRDERFHDNPLVTGPYQVRFYAGVPLPTKDALNMGTLCVVDMKPRTLTEHQRNSLITLAHQAAAQLELLRYLKRLDQKNRDLRAIMKNISLGIFAITKNGVIHEDHSEYLKKLLNNQQLSGKNVVDAVFRGTTNLNRDQIDQIHNIIMASIGEDEVAYDTNVHTLPQEVQLNTPSGLRLIELGWDKIQGEDKQTDKILVSMKDVTEQRDLARKAADQQDALDMLRELVDLDHSKFVTFYKSATRFIAENLRLLEQNKTLNEDLIKLLFVNMHTIKGDARSLHFSRIVSRAHEIEDRYVKIFRHRMPELFNLQDMKSELKDLQDRLDSYKKVAVEKLGREADRESVVQLDKNELHAHSTRLSQIPLHALPESDRMALTAFLKFLNNSLYHKAETVFGEFQNYLPRLASDLGKPTPQLKLKTNSIAFSDTGAELVRSVFVHILRNSLDHGIETADERVKAGKDPDGRLEISVEQAGPNLVVLFKDDGHGLDLARIREVGMRRGLCKLDVNIESLAQLIFANDFSTANTLTDISGRGMGMSAIRQFVEKEGGKVDLVLYKDQMKDQKLPFSLRITLPRSLAERENTALAKAS